MKAFPNTDYFPDTLAQLYENQGKLEKAGAVKMQTPTNRLY